MDFVEENDSEENADIIFEIGNNKNDSLEISGIF